MRVRTIKTHFNEHGGSYEKNGSAGPVYEVADEREAKRLIKLGYVEKHDGSNREARRVSGTGSSTGRAAKGDSSKRAATGVEESRDADA